MTDIKSLEEITADLGALADTIRRQNETTTQVLTAHQDAL